MFEEFIEEGRRAADRWTQPISVEPPTQATSVPSLGQTAQQLLRAVTETLEQMNGWARLLQRAASAQVSPSVAAEAPPSTPPTASTSPVREAPSNPSLSNSSLVQGMPPGSSPPATPPRPTTTEEPSFEGIPEDVDEYAGLMTRQDVQRPQDRRLGRIFDAGHRRLFEDSR